MATIADTTRIGRCLVFVRDHLNQARAAIANRFALSLTGQPAQTTDSAQQHAGA